MAHFLQAISALALLSQVAGAAPFSHKLHLEMKLPCLNCHISALVSTTVEDNNLPPAAVCTNCHQDARAIKEPRASKVSKFNHQLHLKMGNIAPVLAAAIDSGSHLSLSKAAEFRRFLDSKNACEACHRGLGESEVVTDAAFPQMADCLVCHTKREKIEPPYSCATCHAKSFTLTPANHDTKWLDFHGSGKANLDRQSCVVCHDRKFTCRGCH